MIKTHVRHRSLVQRVKRVKLPIQLSEAVLDILVKWISCSGHEFAISRFKNIKADLISFRATGQKPTTPWVGKTKAGNFSGVFGVLQRLMLTEQWSEVLYLMNMYTFFKSDKLTDTQWSKWIKSVESSPTPWGDYLDRIYKSPTLSETSKQIYPRIPHVLESSPKRSHIPRILSELRNSKSIYHVAYESPQVYRKGLAGLTADGDQLLRSLIRFKASMNPLRQLFKVGKVGITQEHGFKARFYFDPDLWIQYLLLPLKDSLMEILTRLPWDCTHQQSKAFSTVQQHLREGRTCHCFDLSDATNYFPFALQHLVLEKVMGNGPLVRLFSSICDHGFWLCPDKKWRSLARGQAMGLGPSFPLFAMTHGFLIESLLGRKWSKEFFVLGDDLIILDDLLATKYQKALEDLKIPYSANKTLRSNRMAEFAGFLIEKDRVVHVPKWKGLNRSNCVDLCAARPDLIGLLPKPAQTIVRWVLSLPQPWGIGLNPDGLPFSERCPDELLVRLDDPDEVPQPREVSLLKKLREWLSQADQDNLLRDWVYDPAPIERLEQRRARKCHYTGWLFNHCSFPLIIKEELEGLVENQKLPLVTKPGWSKPSRGGLSRWKKLYSTYITIK